MMMMSSLSSIRSSPKAAVAVLRRVCSGERGGGGRGSNCALHHFFSSTPYSFLEESQRWKHQFYWKNEAGADDDDDEGTIVTLTQSEWDSLVNNISSEEIKAWLSQTQTQQGLIHVPTPWIPKVLASSGHKTANDNSATTNGVQLFRLENDDDDSTKSSEGGFRSRSKQPQWARLAKDIVRVNNTGGTVSLTLSQITDLVLQSYTFHRYKSSSGEETSNSNSNSNKKSRIRLQSPPPSPELEKETEVLLDATFWAQDLISTPANDLTPAVLQDAAEEWVATQPTTVTMETVVGNDLLDYNGALTTNFGCGMIYAVGQAAGTTDGDELSRQRAPRLIKITYTPQSTEPYNSSLQGTTTPAPIAIVGKGVTYDTGGLNLKPGSSMQQMKKDMGGAANALGLTRALVETGFPHPITTWIPVVENALGSNSYRPGDILRRVNGKTTEIGNTDAEGRLILADALVLACAESPRLVVDFATLTGAARVALGAEIPAVFGNTPELIPLVMEASKSERDPLWHMPLWEGYRHRLKTDIADLRNVPNDSGLGGAITAALYLSEFINAPWLHVDFIGVDTKTTFGLAQGMRAMYRFLQSNSK